MKVKSMSTQWVKVIGRVLGGYVVAVIAVTIMATFIPGLVLNQESRTMNFAGLSMLVALVTVLPFGLCAVLGEIFAVRQWSYYCSFSLTPLLRPGFVGAWISDVLSLGEFGIILALGFFGILLAPCVIFVEKFNIRRQVYHCVFTVLTAFFFVPEFDRLRRMGAELPAIFACTLVGGLVYWAVSGRHAGSSSRFNARAGA
jgi:hypothetical protein